uniref:Tetraspanin n=1 Tax=Parascaris univalens TaxID=6257 RepID=A0A915AJG7_PARUN
KLRGSISCLQTTAHYFLSGRRIEPAPSIRWSRFICKSHCEIGCHISSARHGVCRLFSVSEDRMGLGCGARCLKFCLFIFNLVFLMCGFVCVGIGIWLLFDRYAVDNLAAATAKVQGNVTDDGLRELASKPTAVRQIGTLLMVGGVIVIVVSFLGCCGAAKEWRPLLCCYATCLMVILATEIAAAIYAAMHSHMFERDFRQILKASLKMYNGTDAMKKHEDNTVLVKAAWDKFMIEKLCCGVDSKIGDFNESGWYQLTKRLHHFPPACCPPTKDGSLMEFCPTISRYGDGCYAKIKESVQDLSTHFKIVAWTVCIIALIQVFGITVAFCLCNAITDDEIY